MRAPFFVAASLASVAYAQSVGSAVVVNACDYEVYLANTPSADGGYQEIDAVLAANGGTYGQVFTELSNGNGWSLKLSQSKALDSIMQYEYTFHNDGTIWFDLSDVNGNPWDGNWEITSNSSKCVPKQSAYRYSTDDAYGMQACPQDSIITVELCSGDEGASASAAISVAVPTTTIAPAITLGSSSIPTTAVTTTSFGALFAEVSSSIPTTADIPTTLATLVAEASGVGEFSEEVVSMSAVEASSTAAPTPTIRQWRHVHKHYGRGIHHDRHRRRSHAHG
jgi:hypothetical protein